MEHSIGPVREANHVWLIFVIVLMWTGIPAVLAAGLGALGVGALLLVPSLWWLYAISQRNHDGHPGMTLVPIGPEVPGNGDAGHP